MKAAALTFALTLLMTSMLAGCGGDDGANENDGSSTGGTTATGGAASGGTSGSGGEPVPGACSPGDVFAEADLWDHNLSNCWNYDAAENGLPESPFVDVRQITLQEATVAGQPYSLSINVKFGNPAVTLELWGTNDSCGAAEELLYSAPMNTGMLCADMTPSASYSSLLMVWRSSEDKIVGIGDITSCPSGSCGN